MRAIDIGRHLTRARRHTPDSAPKAWGRRLSLLAEALGAQRDRQFPSRLTASMLAPTLSSLIDPTDRELVWLAVAVMSGVIPQDFVVTEVARDSEFDGGESLAEAVIGATTPETVGWDVEIAKDTVLVDVSATLTMPFTTGIQRVVRETVPRWLDAKACRPASWAFGFAALRDLTGNELAQLRAGANQAHDAGVPEPPARVIVPWRSTLIAPEVLAERARSSVVRSIAQFARCRTGAIGYDCVPMTSSETLIEWMGDTFSWHLAALRYFDRVATISEAAATEFRGWRRMLSAIGQRGPAIDAVLLPAEVPVIDKTTLERARLRFLVSDLPLVLVVGSAEPRKNHLAVLHAAELLWRENRRFSLTFVGGRAWGDDAFGKRVAELQAAGRAVEIARDVDDQLLYAAYRVSRFTVFPSLNEGFGLPAAESLASGTPVVTSDFGSMREIGEGGGAVLVDPRDDHAIAAGMRTLLDDEGAVHRMSVDAQARPIRTWQQYADELWEFLVCGRPARPTRDPRADDSG